MISAVFCYVNKKMLGSDEVITLEELDVRLYNKGIEDGKYTGEKAESFEDLKDLIGKEENIEFGNDPANEIFLILQGLYSNEAITNISDAVCCYKYASTSAGGMGETL